MSILNFLFRYHVKRKRIRQIPTRVVMVDHMGSATENQMESTILNGKGGDVFVWEEGVHGTSKSLFVYKKTIATTTTRGLRRDRRGFATSGVACDAVCRGDGGEVRRPRALDIDENGLGRALARPRASY